MHLTLPLSSIAPRRARHAFDIYDGIIEPTLLHDLRLVTSELVTNSVRHSGRPEGDPITVDLTLHDDFLRLEVTDKGERRDGLRPRSQDPPSGLAIVGQISDRCSSPHASTCQVCCEIQITRNNGLIGRTYSPDEGTGRECS